MPKSILREIDYVSIAADKVSIIGEGKAMSAGRNGGRGAYFREKYGRGRGGGGGGRGTSGHGANVHNDKKSYNGSTHGSSWPPLERDLQSIDGQQYGAYKRLLGKYEYSSPTSTFTLSVDHVQPDAYAAPSRVRAIMPWEKTGLPGEYLSSDTRRIALCDFITRVCASMIRARALDRDIGEVGSGWSGPKGGAFNIAAAGQEILPRTSVMIHKNESIELRFTTSLPAAGRTVLGQQAHQILVVNLVQLVEHSLLYSNLDQAALKKHVLAVENQQSLRRQLPAQGLVAFVANGSILPRASGASSSPMNDTAVVHFQSPAELEITLTLADGISVSGMGVPCGVSLLTGGGFHGKSTLLEAIELGIYDHIPGDGRELVVTDPTAVKIRAEDGRGVVSTDISPFISALPGGKDTQRFSTTDASGSTSMAANIQEALEVGCEALLIDEDSSATNLLVRDQRMQHLIRNEPITPLVAKVRSLYEQHGVSTLIVVGGLGDWLSVADHVIALEDYRACYMTDEAKVTVQQFPCEVHQSPQYGNIPTRRFRVDLRDTKSPYAKSKRFISIRPGEKNPVDDPAEVEPGVDIGGLDQVVEIGQARLIAALLTHTSTETREHDLTLPELLKKLGEKVGIERCLPTSLPHGDLVGVRSFEFVAALSRLREIVTVR